MAMQAFRTNFASSLMAAPRQASMIAPPGIGRDQLRLGGAGLMRCSGLDGRDNPTGWAWVRPRKSLRGAGAGAGTASATDKGA